MEIAEAEKRLERTYKLLEENKKSKDIIGQHIDYTLVHITLDDKNLVKMFNWYWVNEHTLSVKIKFRNQVEIVKYLSFSYLQMNEYEKAYYRAMKGI